MERRCQNGNNPSSDLLSIWQQNSFGYVAKELEGLRCDSGFGTVPVVRWPLTILAMIALTGCAGSPLERMVAPERAAAREDQICQSYGAAPGSQRYQDCRMQLSAEGNRRAAAALDNVAATPMYVPRSNPAVNCTTTGPYGYRTTTCN